MITNKDTDAYALLHLLQLANPNLPVGGFMYSQGLEYAIEAGWVGDALTLKRWLSGLLATMSDLDVPILLRLQTAVLQHDLLLFTRWSHVLRASRETRELRLEEANRAQALTKLLVDLKLEIDQAYLSAMQLTPVSAMALAAARWQIPGESLALAYVWNWLENQISAAIRLLPFGHSAGQRLQLEMIRLIPDVVDRAITLDDQDIGASNPALAIASSRHENQYTRLFRS